MIASSSLMHLERDCPPFAIGRKARRVARVGTATTQTLRAILADD
jgi:hypothetical protein